MGKAASDLFALQLQISDETIITQITLYGVDTWKGISLTAGTPDGSVLFALNTHGYSKVIKQVFKVPRDQYVMQVDVLTNQNTISWMRFTLSNGVYFETGP